MGKQDKKDNVIKKEGAVISDPRFAAVQYDPRFQRFPKAKSKVQVDERFAGMFHDPAFQVGTTLNKRGRKVSNDGKKRDDMRKYYRLKDEDEWQNEKKKGEQQSAEESEEEETQRRKSKAKERSKRDASESEEEEEEEESEEEVDDEAAQRWARMRGLAGPDTSSSEDEDDQDDKDNKSEDDDEDPSGSDLDALLEEEEEREEEAAREFGIGALAANPRENIPLLPDATSRIACVDLDWENVRAVDILAALRSFLPRNGKIKGVTVYPSDYGLERMAAEAKAGPQGIWKSKRNKEQKMDDDDIEEDDREDKEEDEEEEEDDEGAVDPARLRLYERSKLRWYYAIIECDSTETANHLYEECDGMELMKTACKFDLRFVPEDQSFAHRQVRDKAVEVPDDYTPPTFQTKALQHTNVELTWDKGDENRRKMLSKKVTADELKEDDFKAYLATDSDESSGDDDVGRGEGDDDENDDGEQNNGKKYHDRNDAEAIRERYRRLLLSSGHNKVKQRQGGKDWTDDEDAGVDSDNDKDNDKNMEMEVTFVPGLDGLGDRLVAKKREATAKAEETVWAAYLRRKREKKAEAKRLGKVVNIDDSDDDSMSGDEGTGAVGRNNSMDGDALPTGVAHDPFFQHEDDPFNDPFFQDGATNGEKSILLKDNKKKSSASKKSAKGGDGTEVKKDSRAKAELEMLLMDQDALLRRKKISYTTHNGIDDKEQKKKLSKKDRIRLKKEARRRERAAGSDDDDHEEAFQGAEFKVNLEDPRFEKLLTAPEFALDPTDPRFIKAGPQLAAIAAEVTKRRNKDLSTSQNTASIPRKYKNDTDKNEGGNGENGGVTKADLKLMVASLKRKSAAVVSSTNKKKNLKR